ncbi:uncharacterized protein LY79DRAFT_380136 [Colletotrichum navitas]|uniref:Uncharacterized protein n=1 Tax=Colletotrichum navitas TaxID=681940 RepID=A0AAD8Q7C1_9PEZI|nr:uncharacterized protein LY79DRAFT_380136 [Colletotrichum navitas]KAK1597286.1 hypothetical protein LY79DRAFT_380136 [Colletotrichum navitas]
MCSMFLHFPLLRRRKRSGVVDPPRLIVFLYVEMLGMLPRFSKGCARQDGTCSREPAWPKERRDRQAERKTFGWSLAPLLLLLLLPHCKCSLCIREWMETPNESIAFLALSKRGPGRRMAYVSPSWKLLLRKVIRRHSSTRRSHVYGPCMSGLGGG